MTAQTTTYDGTHFQVALMNMRDGSVQGHAAGCNDLKRGIAKFAEPHQAEDIWDVLSKQQAREGYNADFDEETDGWYDIEWLPCAKHVPATHEEEAPADEPGSDFAVDGVTVKVGRKWTYMYLDGVLIAEVLNEQAETVRRALLHI